MRDQLDDILDEALATYAENPRPCLERRVLRRVQSTRKRWPLVLPVFALAAMICWIVVPQPKTLPPQLAVVPQEHPVMPVSVAKPGIPGHRSPAALPKQSVFPSATALSEAEKALLSLAQGHPEIAERVSKSSLEPIEIQPIEIRPLQTENGQ